MKTLTLVLAASVIVLAPSRQAWSDPPKPYRFDVRTIANEMCVEMLPLPLEKLPMEEGSACTTTFETCKSTLSDLAAMTADLKGFYKEGPYLYATSVVQYMVFYEEFRKHHICMKMTSFDDYSGAEVPMASVFTLDYDTLKSALTSSCLIFPADPCGNGVTDPGEMCDDGPDNGKPGKCGDGCRLPIMRPFRLPDLFRFTEPSPVKKF